MAGNHPPRLGKEGRSLRKWHRKLQRRANRVRSLRDANNANRPWFRSHLTRGFVRADGGL